MAAFEKGGASGGPGGPDLDDILAQMFGGMGGGMPGGMGGMPPGFEGMPGMGRGGPRKSKNEVQEYEVTLEELYKGKTTRFASTKNVICSLCHGSGGKEKAKAKKCDTCEGKGMRVTICDKLCEPQADITKRHKNSSTSSWSRYGDAANSSLLYLQRSWLTLR